MTAAEVYAGWSMLTAAERRAFGATLVELGVVTGPEATRLVLAPLRDVRVDYGSRRLQ